VPLQNRVDPFGDVHAVPDRGLFMGNRGIIHDPDTKALLNKRWTLKAWIICVCEFKGKRREPMGRNRPNGKAGWTELFFLDEVTALAAGHRPCFFCRRERAKDFAARFGDVFKLTEPRAPEIDVRLHRERLASGGKAKPLAFKQLSELPDGVMITANGKPFALRNGLALPWSFGGYGPGMPLSSFRDTPSMLLTPSTTVAILGGGYRPAWHPSAQP
jgi:hypothetical protein